MINYLSTADVAAWFNVAPATVTKWVKRHDDFPTPDATIGDTIGWNSAREPEIREWHRNRPGQGSGGGRPRQSHDHVVTRV